jgi:glycosyltransferase involved in cell wall biosynthesis
MTAPKVSVVIPAYNHASFLSATIQCVLKQTFEDFELIIVNDGSTDATPNVVRQFCDSRIKYLEQANRGATAARNTGMQASCGSYIALLDADDIWSPDKLQVHVNFLDRHSEVGVSYNGRFAFVQSIDAICDLHLPPAFASLSDFVLGFPFSPSDMVLRREWAFKVNLFDERYVFFGDDLDFFCRLALAGCQFASVGRVLNFRRYHAGRTVKDLRASVEAALRPLEEVFSDPRCPNEVLALKDAAYANHYVSWALDAFNQDETVIGRELLCKAIESFPSLAVGWPSAFTRSVVQFCAMDTTIDPLALLEQIARELPPQMCWKSEQFDWVVAHVYLTRGVRNALWSSNEMAEAYFVQAAQLGATLDEAFIEDTIARLLRYETEFGREATQVALHNLTKCLRHVMTRRNISRLSAGFWATQAFNAYDEGGYSAVVPCVLRAIAYEPTYLTNRGMISISIRSMLPPLRNGLGRYRPHVSPRSILPN